MLLHMKTVFLSQKISWILFKIVSELVQLLCRKYLPKDHWFLLAELISTVVPQKATDLCGFECR